MIRNCLTVLETAERLGCGRTKVFELIAQGKLKCGHSFGRKTLVRVDSIEALERSVEPRPLPARGLKSVPAPAPSLEDELQALSDFRRSLGTK